MKNTKKFLALLLVAVMVILTFTACGENVARSGIATVAVEKTADGEACYNVYEVDLSKLDNRKEGALSLLEYIASQEGSTLYYNVQWGGGYGAYLTSIDSLDPDPASQYIAVYTSEEKDFAVPGEWSPTVATVDYGGMTLAYSGVGITSMTVNDGTVVLFRLEGF